MAIFVSGGVAATTKGELRERPPWTAEVQELQDGYSCPRAGLHDVGPGLSSEAGREASEVEVQVLQEQ